MIGNQVFDLGYLINHVEKVAEHTGDGMEFAGLITTHMRIVGKEIAEFENAPEISIPSLENIISNTNDTIVYSIGEGILEDQKILYVIATSTFKAIHRVIKYLNE